MTFFIRACPPMKATGWKPAITATVSDRGWQRIGDLTGTATGFGPIAAGTGIPTNVLAGPLTITVDGSILMGPDGAGSPETNGLRPGSLGERVNKHIGWAPLPPEADISAHQSISSWSDSYYGIGPAAYAFMRYSHWREPNYTQYIERPERNVQIIRDTRNVTNIVNQNNVINNFGPQVQMVAQRTNHPIPQVNLALNRATDPRQITVRHARQSAQSVSAPSQS